LNQLIELIEDVAKKAGKKLTRFIQTQLQQWIAGLPSAPSGNLDLLLLCGWIESGPNWSVDADHPPFF